MLQEFQENIYCSICFPEAKKLEFNFEDLRKLTTTRKIFIQMILILKNDLFLDKSNQKSQNPKNLNQNQNHKKKDFNHDLNNFLF